MRAHAASIYSFGEDGKGNKNQAMLHDGTTSKAQLVGQCSSFGGVIRILLSLRIALVKVVITTVTFRVLGLASTKYDIEAKLATWIHFHMRSRRLCQ